MIREEDKIVEIRNKAVYAHQVLSLFILSRSLTNNVVKAMFMALL
ncbi:hypothetical protein [Calothrix sp. PCC 6303]|nr:hypothetical protein [Calothrix sp. PCC 6303]AFZ01221.1 hypothetical protein Cal6303_2201 [Calothrix sp. PCC 6303]